MLLPGVNVHRGQQARIVVPCTNRKTKGPKARDMKIRKDPTDGEMIGPKWKMTGSRRKTRRSLNSKWVMEGVFFGPSLFKVME